MEIEMSREFSLFWARKRSAGAAGVVAVWSLLVMVPAAQAQQPAPPAQTAAPTLQLSMTQAVTMALETNLGLKADRIDVDYLGRYTNACWLVIQAPGVKPF
jgi:hypothetical protein